MNLSDFISPDRLSDAPGNGMRAGKLLHDAGETLRTAGHYMIEITDGVHAGASITQKTGTVTIGSSKDNDLVLFGSNIADKHLEITLPAGLMGKPVITPLEGTVNFEDGSTVEIGQYAEIHMDELIAFGDAKIILNRIADPKKFVKPGLRLMAFLCVMLMLPIIYNMFSGAVVGIADAGSRVVGSLSHTIDQTSKRYLGTSAGLSSGGTNEINEAFAWTVRTKLEDLKLNHRLRAASTPDGSVRVYGSVSDKELPRWTSFLQWYDTTSGFPPLIRDVNRSDIDQNLPLIKSVWLDAKPTVFFKDGSVGGIGANIKDGWKIVDITNASVSIERDGAIISLTY